MNFLVSYKPLVMNGRGKTAIRRFGFPPYVDHSCRREPDFESEFPSITAMCRRYNFAPRLNEWDVAVYITTKGKYSRDLERHWRLTAILRVIKRFKSHRRASKWYQNRGLELPSNCMVRANPPLGLDKTSNPDRLSRVQSWDALYWIRSREIGVFLVCRPLFLDLYDPPVVTEQMMYTAFGRVPGTRTPPKISDMEYQTFTTLVGVFQ